MRRPTTVELMLLSAIGPVGAQPHLQPLHPHPRVPAARVLDRPLRPASLVFAGIVLAAERSLRVSRHDIALVVAAASVLWLNQIGFVYSLKTTSASVIALIMGATPIFAAVIGLALGTEILPARFWLGAGLSFAGVALVAIGTGTELSGDLGASSTAVATAATWAVYSVPSRRSCAATRRRGSAPSSSRSLGRDRGHRLAADELAGLGASAGSLGAPRRRDARPARRHEHPLVPLAAPDRAVARDAGHEPAALPRRGRRGRAARGAHEPRAGAGRRADRRRDPRARPPPRRPSRQAE